MFPTGIVRAGKRAGVFVCDEQAARADSQSQLCGDKFTSHMLRLVRRLLRAKFARDWGDVPDIERRGLLKILGLSGACEDVLNRELSWCFRLSGSRNNVRLILCGACGNAAPSRRRRRGSLQPPPTCPFVPDQRSREIPESARPASAVSVSAPLNTRRTARNIMRTGSRPGTPRLPREVCSRRSLQVQEGGAPAASENVTALPFRRIFSVPDLHQSAKLVVRRFWKSAR